MRFQTLARRVSKIPYFMFRTKELSMRPYIGASGIYLLLYCFLVKGTAYAPNSKGGWYIKAYYRGTIYAL